MKRSSLTGTEVLDGQVCCSIDELPLPYLEIDEEGWVVRANRARKALQYSDMPDLVGHQPWESMPSPDSEEAKAEYLQSIAAGEEHPKYRRVLFTNTGEYRTFDIYCSLIRDAGGHIHGMRVMSVDVTDSLKALEEANRSRMWIESVLDTLPEAVLVTDALGSIVYANQAMEKLSGWTASELISRQLESLPAVEIPEKMRGNFGFRVALRGEVNFEATISDRAGKLFRVSISSKPMVETEGGATTGVVIVIHPLTQPA